jgi:oxaloacetate decarboxylase alpha subunit
MDHFREETAKLVDNPPVEDVLSYALFPQVAADFFKYRKAQQEGVDLTKGNKDAKAYPV